ncbi:MAG: hypothetical protein COT14_00115 [Candidatus Diapherotrites archaeon CG08_land_8_20_14_0_20_30_16]|nr:MAG: hypothetical protein COT14_00115 [Candidatus Diapherotrites archaeon CG08_land_8_20_14_0_20_30_16]
MPEKPKTKVGLARKITRRFSKKGRIEIAKERLPKVNARLNTLKLWLESRSAFEKDPDAQRDKLFYWVGGSRRAYVEAGKKLSPKDLEKWKQEANARYNTLKREVEKKIEEFTRLIQEKKALEKCLGIN